MGTYIKQTVYCSNPQEICSDTINSIKELENKLSWRISNSEISKINNASENEPVSISSDLLDILDTSIKVSNLSNHAFNPAILPLSKLWDFSNTNPTVPSVDSINNVLPYLNCNNLIIDKKNNTVIKKDTHTRLDLGSIGKGTACDTAVNMYKSKNIKAGIISAGGSIGVYGKKDNNMPWNIAIRNPFITDENEASFALLNIDSGFVSTSGAYEKNFTVDNKFYHHILSTDTGYPVENNLMSVTVYHSNGTISDILSTACYVLGTDKSKDLLDQYNASALFVDKNKKIIASSSLKDKINLTDKTFYIAEWI